MFSTAIFSACLCLVPSQDPAGASTPSLAAALGVTVGNSIPGPFFPYNLTGNRETSYACPITAIEDNPCVLVFLQSGEEGSDSVKKLLTDLDNALSRYKRDNLHAFVIVVDSKIDGTIHEKDDERNAAADKLKTWIGSLMLKSLNFGLDSAAGVKPWGIPSDKAVTAVLYQNYKVLGLHSLTTAELTDEKVGSLLGELVSKKMVQPRRNSPLPLPRP